MLFGLLPSEGRVLVWFYAAHSARVSILVKEKTDGAARLLTGRRSDDRRQKTIRNRCAAVNNSFSFTPRFSEAIECRTYPIAAT